MPRDAPVVQWIERRPSKPHVAGSNPAGGAGSFVVRLGTLLARTGLGRPRTAESRATTLCVTGHRMRKRADRLWLLFFVPGATLVGGHFVLTRLLGVALPDLASSLIGGLGVGLLVLSLLTQVPLPRRGRKKPER